jgi:hypothetical protein
LARTPAAAKARESLKCSRPLQAVLPIMQWWTAQKLKSKRSASRRDAVQSLAAQGDSKRVLQWIVTSLSDRIPRCA